MTVIEAITQFQNVKPNQYGDDVLVKWLSDIDSIIYSEVISWHTDTEDIPHGPYTLDDDADTPLMVPEPYSDVYIKYLSAQVDYYNGEFGRYNNSMVMYNMAYSAYADWYNRNHMPKQPNYVIM